MTTGDGQDGGRWLTYRELASELGCSVQAARIMAIRRQYPRQFPNEPRGQARVLVPLNLGKKRSSRPTVGDNRSDSSPSSIPYMQVLEGLQDQVKVIMEMAGNQVRLANERADRAEQQVLDERRRREAIETEMDARRDWPLHRRLRWAFGRGR